MPHIKKFIVPISMALITAALVWTIVYNPPGVKNKKPTKPRALDVEVQAVYSQAYTLLIDSYGLVQPKTQSTSVSQVSGEVVNISERFREGGFFNKGDVLLTIDNRDYIADVNIAKAELAFNEVALKEEQAQAKQASDDWQRLRPDTPASDLVLRLPQLRYAEANVLAATAKLDKAQLALSRTKIIAPYSGRVLNKYVDIGQLVSTGTPLADIYATDTVEIRLPINNQDLKFLDLPEEYSDGSNNQQDIEVTLKSDLINQQQWQGRIIRTEGAIDNNSQQLYVVAQIDTPFANTQQASIKIGQYVTATIRGKTIEKALIIPNHSIYQGSYVYIVKNDELYRTDITVLWQNETETLVEAQFTDGALLVTTALGLISSGTRVKPLNTPEPLPNVEPTPL